MFPLFTGKAGLEDRKQGDIYSSLQQHDVPCQITTQVGQDAPPCWGEDKTVPHRDIQRKHSYLQTAFVKLYST